jgi:hypothetical protein
MKRYTTFAQIILPPITESSQLATIFESLSQYKTLTPFKYGEVDPMRDIFDANKISEISERHFRAFHLAWYSAKNVSLGSIMPNFGRGKTTAYFSISTSIERISPPDMLVDLIQDVFRRSKGIYGYIHYLSEAELQRLAKSDTIKCYNANSPTFGVNRFQLVRCLPNLYWANVFGPEYVALFGGAERLRSAPAPIVKELAPNIFYIQLSDNMLDFATRHSEIDAVRERVKQHLGADCFFDYEATFTRKYRVPNLGWEEPSRPPMTVEEIIQSLKEGKMNVVDTTGGEYRKALE